MYGMKKVNQLSAPIGNLSYVDCCLVLKRRERHNPKGGMKTLWIKQLQPTHPR
jgi:hypothetical protein